MRKSQSMTAAVNGSSIAGYDPAIEERQFSAAVLFVVIQECQHVSEDLSECLSHCSESKCWCGFQKVRHVHFVACVLVELMFYTYPLNEK